MFARDKPLFTPHKEKPAAAADAITMEGVGIRAAMKYKSKTFFQVEIESASLGGRFEGGEKSVFTKLQREFERHSWAAAERERGLEIERKMI